MPKTLPKLPKITANEQQLLSDALFNSLGDGVIATNEFGKITRINPRALQLLGYTEKELLGSWFPRKIVSQDETTEITPLIDRPITQAFLTGKTITKKTFYRHKNGKSLPVDITVSPIMVNGRPVGAVEVFRDITTELEIDHMKSDFISLASHQLRTPLSSIKTYSHMLVDGYMGNLTPAQRKAVKTIIGASNRMNELISTLLNVTRLESGSVTVNPRPVHVVRLLEEINKEHTLAANDKELELVLTTSPKTQLRIHSDAILLKEALSNLISNAIKYTPPGGRVTVGVKNQGENVIFSITDTGVGIPKFAQEQVFSKFFRAHNVVKQETSGTGLGLYLVRGLIDALGGKVWFESHENTGTTFFVELPKAGGKLK